MKYPVSASFAYSCGLRKEDVEGSLRQCFVCPIAAFDYSCGLPIDKLRQKVVQLTLGVFEELRPSSDNLVECTVRRSCLSELQAMMLMRYLHIQHDDHWTAFSARNMMVVLFNKEKQ